MHMSIIHSFLCISNILSQLLKYHITDAVIVSLDFSELMDLSAIKRLLQSKRPSDEYIAGVQGFLKFAYSGKKSDAKIQCPCVKCVNRQLQMQETVYEHLVCDGMLRGYTIWGCHGETSSYISTN